jgi:hypothetical protein
MFFPTIDKADIATLIFKSSSNWVRSASLTESPKPLFQSDGRIRYLVIIYEIIMQLDIKIKNMIQEAMLICFFSLVVGMKPVFSFMRFSNNLENSKKTETPIIPKIKYGSISKYDGSGFLVTITITPVRPITAIAPPISLLSVKGKCLISELICFMIFSILI